MSTVDAIEQATNLTFVLRFPTVCVEEVTRHGQLCPCEKQAVAARMDTDGNWPYPVCAYHARGDMVPLADVIKAAKR